LKKLVLFCFLVLVSKFLVVAQSQDIKFTSLTTKDGLSSNTVNAILKDRYGLIWFGTEDGLDKFDGTNFSIYRHKPGDSTSLQANEILSLYEDKAGNLWVGTSGGSLSRYDRKRDVFVNFIANGKPNRLDNNVIINITSDHTGKIWVAHFDGVNILDPATGNVTKFPNITGSSAVMPHTRVVFEDRQNRMWIGTWEGLFLYNYKTNTFVRFRQSKEDPYSLAGDYVNAITEDNYGNVWIGTDGGLSQLPAGQSAFINYRQNSIAGKGLSSNFINAVSFEGDKLWIGTGEGLDILDPKTGVVSGYKEDYRNIHSLTAKSVRCIYIDKEGICWLGTVAGGVDKYDKNLNLFNSIRSNVFDEKGLNAPIVTSFAEDGRGKIYVGTEGKGLSVFDMETKLFKPVKLQSKRKKPDNYLSVLALEASSRNELLVGTYSDGLFVLNPVSGTYKQMMSGTSPDELNSNNIFCITEIHSGNIWVGTNGEGINVLNRENKVIVRYTPNPTAANDIKLPINGFIRDIREDSEGNIWIATHGGGIAGYYPPTGKFTIYNTNNSNLPNDKVQSLHEDTRGNIWVATFGGGVSLLEKKSKSFETFSENNGLQNSTVYKILEDKNGLIWVSTNKGISSIDATTRKIINYNSHNGVQNNNFFHGAGLQLSNGYLFFGGLEGFNYFNPAHLKKNNSVARVLITDLKISNRSVVPAENGPIKEHISVAKEINLDYKQNFALSFVGLNYTAPEQNQYAYKLEGFDKDWNLVGASTSASYTNLDPGEYTFRVKASNNDGVWNNEGTSIKIYVHPPFWRSTLAYIFYIATIVGLLFYSRYKGIQKLKRKFALEEEKNRVELDRKEAERIHELDRLKIKFLTNLSHEFRTPISLILGPVDNLLVEEKNSRTYNQLQMVKRNARRLLNMVNQLLDFRKMEENELRLNATRDDLVSFAREVSDSFKDLSERKKIDFVFTTQVDSFITLFDHDKLERILFNLLSNAFKFTFEGGTVKLILDKEENAGDPLSTLIVKISDTGIGIPAESREKIFEHFFQHTTPTAILNQGSGIGLAITNEFVKMHGGTISVESEVGRGSVFTIRLPFEVLNVSRETVEIPIETTEKVSDTLPIDLQVEEYSINEVLSPATTELPTILLVEDNEDFRAYIRDNLPDGYKVVEAANGKEGWQKALFNHPQLIVSDISMPVMNGIELCLKIKADKRTTHIPVILLTALTGEEDQLKGLKTGANDYITKPFNSEVLNTKIKNLLDLKSTLKSTYSKQIQTSAPQLEQQSSDETLLHTIIQYLEENLSNPQLSVEELSRHVGMSRSSLYSKLLEITGQTPVEYIRSVKLNKAAALLEKTDMNVAQIAYSVGFSTPNYFAKSFKAKFNMLPSEYIVQLRNAKKQDQ
jgi:signal transduction histidine kinase/ligand-binding sensor domain-containing protein/DNA-binding response OmpR family regulator